MSDIDIVNTNKKQIVKYKWVILDQVKPWPSAKQFLYRMIAVKPRYHDDCALVICGHGMSSIIIEGID